MKANQRKFTASSLLWFSIVFLACAENPPKPDSSVPKTPPVASAPVIQGQKNCFGVAKCYATFCSDKPGQTLGVDYEGSCKGQITGRWIYYMEYDFCEQHIRTVNNPLDCNGEPKEKPKFDPNKDEVPVPLPPSS